MELVAMAYLGVQRKVPPCVSSWWLGRTWPEHDEGLAGVLIKEPLSAAVTRGSESGGCRPGPEGGEVVVGRVQQWPWAQVLAAAFFFFFLFAVSSRLGLREGAGPFARGQPMWGLGPFSFLFFIFFSV